MKQNTHVKITQIVIENQIRSLNSKEKKALLDANIEPDKINEELMMKDLAHSLTVPIKWLINHTVRSKYLAKLCISKAAELYEQGDPSYLKLLGYGLHYLVDRATPHHSLTSEVNPVPVVTGIGTFLGGLIGGLKKAGQGTKEVLKGIAQGALAGGALSAGISSVGLAMDHSEFEKYCDLYWSEYQGQIRKNYLKNRKNNPKIREVNLDLGNLDELIENLHKDANNISSDWRQGFKGDIFSTFMANIACVIEYACRIVIR